MANIGDYHIRDSIRLGYRGYNYATRAQQVINAYRFGRSLYNSFTQMYIRGTEGRNARAAANGPYPTPPRGGTLVGAAQSGLYRALSDQMRGRRNIGRRNTLMNRRLTYPNRKQMAKRKIVKRRKTTYKTVAKAVMKMEPAKHWTGSINVGSMTHSSIYTWNALGGITQGTTYAQRDGDAIYLEALKLKGFFQTTTSTNAFTYRIMIGWTGSEPSGCDATFGTGMTTDIWLPTTNSSWAPNGIINAKNFTCIADRTFDVPSIVASVVDLASFEMVIPLKQKFVYKKSADSYGKFKNLVVVVTSGIVGGSAGTTVSGATYMGYDLIFKSL